MTRQKDDKIDREVIRSEMWYEITRKNIYEGYITVTKSLLHQVAEHSHYSSRLVVKVWQCCITNSAYKQPRISYLLDAFSFNGQRVLMDKNFDSKEEQVIFALFEHIKRAVK